MPWYNDLRPAQDHKKQQYGLLFPDMKESEKARTIRGVLKLRQYLDKQLVRKETDSNILIASWNIKEFGQLKNRLPESYFYIAEILNRFDLIAIQEVKNTLDDLFIIMKLLGDDWDYLINDITEGRAGNSERSAYVYNKQRVNFSGLAGEIVIWEEIQTPDGPLQLKRTPYITGFQSGWKTFAVVNLHLNPNSNEKDQFLRKKELELLANALEIKIKKKSLWTENLILLGDFNLYKKDQTILTLMEAHGYVETESLQGKPTNVSGTESYDRMFFKENPYFQAPKGKNGGVLTFFEAVYQKEQSNSYRPEMRLHKDNPNTLKTDTDFEKYYEQYWKRAQMSDHYPIWLELKIDSTDEFLAEKLKSYIEE